MAVERLEAGVRRYTCLTPIRIQIGDEVQEWRAVHMLPVTRKIEREWQDGMIQGPHGALEALIDRLTFEPYYVIEEMQHPDVDHFNREFALHLPRSISQMIAEGVYPAPAPPPPMDPEAPDEDERYAPEPYDPGPPPAPPPAAAPRQTPPPPRPAPPPPAASPAAPMPDPNFELAQIGPDPSLGTAAQQDALAHAEREKDGAGLTMARDMLAEQEEPVSPLAAAVKRAQAEQPPAFVPSPRSPFDPEPAPPPRQRNRPPTTLPQSSADSMAMEHALPGTDPRPSAPANTIAPMSGVDPRTNREAIYEAKAGYVPDMTVAGYEAPAPRGPTNQYGIGDLTP